MTCSSIMLKNSVESVGATSQSCFTPFYILKGRERMLLCLTWPSWSSCSWKTMARNFGGQPGFLRIFQSPFLLTVSNAFVGSTKVMNNPFFCSRYFSWISLRANTMSVAPRLALKPHWLSGRCFPAIVGTSLFSNTLATILPAMERIVIPR